jgi:hypothetical protein
MKRYLLLAAAAVALGAYSSSAEIGRGAGGVALGPLGSDCLARDVPATSADAAARHGCHRLAGSRAAATGAHADNDGHVRSR